MSIYSRCAGTRGKENDNLMHSVSLVDERMIYHIGRDILGLEGQRSPLDALNEYLHVVKKTGGLNAVRFSSGVFSYNTWPFGESTTETFNRLLAVCRGRQNLKSTLDAITEQCGRMKDKLIATDEKSMFLLTDKWNAVTFKEYERAFLEFARDYNIWFVFILVTDYGYTQIPFLPNNRDFKLEIELPDDIKKTYDMLEIGEFTIKCDNGLSGGKIFSFVNEENEWVKTDDDSSRSVVSKVKINRFLHAVSWIASSPENHFEYLRYGFDIPRRTLDIYGKIVEWSIPEDSDRGSIAARLEHAMNRLING